MLSKAELRKLLKQKLDESSALFPAQSETICNILLAHSHIHRAKKIAMYEPRPNEPDITRVFETYKDRCLFPNWTLDNPNMDYQYDGWTPDDIFLVPGLAFSENGCRLGSGKGYFDRFFAKLPQGIPKWGVCFDFQVLPSLPEEAHDVRMDALVTPAGIQVICP